MRPAGFILLLLLTGCAHQPKGDIIDVREAPSPDGRYICTVFGEKLYYETTGYPRHIDIRRAEEKRGYPGNVYLVHLGDGVSVSWTSPTNLLVRLSLESPHSFPASTNVAGVEVTFSELEK